MKPFVKQIIGAGIIILMRRISLYAVQLIPAGAVSVEFVRSLTVAVITLLLIAVWCRINGISPVRLWKPYVSSGVGKTDCGNPDCCKPDCVCGGNASDKEYRKSRINPIAMNIFAAAAGLAIIAIAGLAISALFSEFTAYDASNTEKLSAGAAAFIIISKIIITPVTEELLYRGVLLRALSPLGRCGAVLISSAVFAAVHPSLPQMLYAFISGIVFASISLRTRSLTLPSCVHALNNIAAAIRYII